MARRPNPAHERRARLLALLDEPVVAAGFAGAAARYVPHLEAGARVGDAAVLHDRWMDSLDTIAHQVALDERDPLPLSAELRRLASPLLRYAERLYHGELQTPPHRPVDKARVPTGRAELRAWGEARGCVEILESPAHGFGLHVPGTLLDVATAAQRRGTFVPGEMVALAREAIVAEAGIALPPVPVHERPPFAPEVAGFAAAIAAHRAKLPPGRLCGGSVGLDTFHSPPIIFVVERFQQIGVEVAPPGKTLRMFFSQEQHAPEAVGRALDAALDLLAWPRPSEQAELVRALSPRWTELLRALEQGAAPRAAPREEREQRLAFRVDPYRGISVLLQKRAKANKKGSFPAGCTPDGFTAGTATPHHKLPDSLPAEELALVSRLRRDYSGVVYDVDNLRLLVGHPRVFDARGERLEVVERQARLTVREQAGGASALELRAGDAVVPPKRLEALGTNGATLDTSDSARLVITTAPPELMPVARALALVGGVIPAEGKDPLLRALAPLQQAQPAFLDVDEALLGARLPPEESVVARLFPEPTASGEVSVALSLGVRALAHAAPFAPDAGPDRIAAVRDGKRVFCVRERERERALCDAVRDALPLEAAESTADYAWRMDTPDAALDVVRALRDVAAAGSVVLEWPEGRAPWQVVDGDTSALKVTVGGKSALTLHVEGAVNVDGAAVNFVRLLDAARAGRRYVTLSEGRFLALSDALRERAAALADAGVASGGALVGAAGLAVALEELEAAGAVVEGSKLWTEWRARLQAAANVGDDVPRGVDAELRPYQREGLRFLRRLVALGTGGVLADDMGLGKTLQAIALLVERGKGGPALVVAPTSVCFNWARELQRFAPALRPQVLHEADDRARTLARLKKHDVLIASYGLMVREQEAFATRAFSTLVLDEAQAIKNAASLRARAVRALQAEVRLALTGTPIENHSGELWSIFAAVAPGLLPPLEEFRERFQSAVDRGTHPERRRALARLVRPFLLRRTKGEVAPELPPRTEIVHRVELEPDERQHYDALRAVLAEKLRATDLPPAQRRVLILSALMRLRQVACHAALDATGGEWGKRPSSKLKALLRLVADLKDNRHRVLVFSQFTRLLDLVEPALREAGASFVRLDGSTSQKERARVVDAFQAGEADVFLLSLKAGGFGLNLTAADYVVHLDPWWNPAAEAQAADRAHRIGQTRPVTVYRLVASGTLEEGVIAMQERKRAIFSGVLEGDVAAPGTLDEAELLSLLEDAAVARAGEPVVGGAEA